MALVKTLDDTLSVGDILCLYSAESYGFIFAAQSSSVHNELAVGARQDKLKPDIQDQHIISFECCVANRYKLNKKYRKLQQKLLSEPDNLQLRTSVAQAKIAADAENEDNDLEQVRQTGKKVVYGQIIQLKNVFTGKYIHVSTTKTSVTESNNMAVELHPINAKHCQFKIMPRYKVKSEGDVVQVDDQVVLESIKSPGSFLHVSKGVLGIASVYSKCFELNISVQQTGFTVIRKYKPATGDEEKIKLGDIIRFYHKEMEAYLVAEGLFDDILLEDVHLRMRPLDPAVPKTLNPSSSAITYWQIESQEGPTAGGLLKWEQQCRIIHMCTRKYLSVDTNGKVTLTSDHLDPRNVFRLHPVIRGEADDIPIDSYCRVEHVMTGHWLHSFTDEYKRKQEVVSEDTTSMSSLKYTKAELRQIGVIEVKQYDDAFTIQSVDIELVQIFNYMAGMVPFIQKIVQDKKEGHTMNAKNAHDTITALTEMREFMIVDSVPCKDRQKLMRNLRIVELLVQLLQIPFRGSNDQHHLTRIFVEAYDVLYTYLMGDSRKNELYIAKHIDFFLQQFEYKEGQIGLNAAHMVMELIKDNRKIVDRISHAHIDMFVELLRRDKNHRYLDLLSVLCVCDGVSIADNQRYITEVWLMKGNRNCVFYTDLGQKIGKVHGVVYVSTNTGRTWKELSVFSQDSESEEYLFLEHQLELFGNLCKGQNDFSIKVITQELNYLTWEEGFFCLSDERLPDRLRAHYCDLIITMFVDIGDNHSVIDRVRLSFIYDGIDELDDVIDMTYAGSVTHKIFPTLSDWISKFLAKNGDMTASQIGNNMLVRQVLRLVEYLVSFGYYYKPEDIKKLLEPLMSLLDGRNDKPYPNVMGKEGEEVLKHFRAIGRYQRSVETQAIVDAKCQALEVLDLFFNFIFNLRLEKFMYIFKVTHTAANKAGMFDNPELGVLLYETFQLEENPGISKPALRKLNQIFERTSYLKNYDLVAVLMDLSHYHYDEMIRKSMALLNRYYSAHDNLFSRAVQAQVLITDRSVDVYNKLEEFLPKFRRYATAKLNQDQTTELCGILDKLIGMLHLEGEPEEEHGMNQSILYNFGVLEDSFKILQQEIDVKLMDQYQRQRKVLEKTFTLMKLMAHNNKIVQGRLFDRLDMLLGKQGAGPELADALTEVFTGNSNTCMKISGYQIQKIMTLVAKNKESVPQFLDLLNAIVKVEELDLPLKRNQGFVMQYFMQFRSDVAFVIDQPEANREAVLTNPSHKDLQYFISMVDMLATCAEGENRFIESICQTIFKIPELLKILNNPGINSNLKRPFLRFFLWVYLNTAGGMIESGAGDLPHEKGMWDYLASLQGTINNVIAFATAQPRVTELLLKRPPSKNDQGQAQEEVIRGSLHYLFDGVMPFIMVFCRSYYQPDTSMFPDEPENIDNLTKTFKAFIQVMAPLISIEKQMKNLVACMTTLLSASTLPVREMEEFQEKYGRGVTAQDVRSAARRDYDEYYAAELEINAQLNVFAVNMKVAYGGLNTVQAQIGYDSDLPYSELGGDEELPLGQEFQEHLKCFIDNTKKLPKDKYKMAEKLVKQMQISQNLTNLDEKEKLEQLDLDVKCLQLLRGLIYNEIVKLPDDWESESSIHIRQLNIIEKTQKALDDYGVVIGVLDHLARPQDQVVREVLAFMSSLLFNGNDQVQASLIKYFTGTREETFFFSIKSRMQMSALATREKRLLNAMHQAKLEEALQQAKALQKAMKSGKAAQDQLQQANQLGSMLSIAKRSMLNLQGASGRLKGSRLSLGKRTPTGSAMGSRMMLKSSNAHPVSNGVTGKAAMMSKSSLNGKGRVGPQPPEIQIEHVADEELEELMQSAVGQEDELEFKDDGYIELVLRILGLMCDNQHHDLQDYLREQPDNIKSVNLVAETTRFLSILYSNITTQSMPLICQLFDTLVEFTSGNQQNQAVVFDNKICDYMNHILRVGSFKGCSKKEIYELKKSIGTLIRSLSEENPPEEESEEDTVTTLSKEVMEYMDEDTLMNTMTDAYLELMLGQAKQKQKNDPDHQELMELYSEVGFIYFHILCRKNDLDYMVTKESMIKKAENQLAWDYFAANTMSIEIVKNNELQKLYFRVKDTKVLREEIKDKFKYEVDRTTPSNKLRSFMDWSSDIIQDIKYQRKVYANPIGRLLVKLWLPMNYLVLFLSVVMAILMMVFWVDPKLQSGESDIDSRKPDFTWDGYPYLVYGIGGIHNLFSFLVLVTFLISNKPTFPPYRKFKNLIRKNDDDEEDFRAWHEKKLDSHLEIPIYSVKTIYYMTFLGCSILGTIFYGYFFAFHLLHIAQLNQLLKRVIQAVTTNGMSLLLVALLGLGIFYIYALVAFAFLREDFLQEAAGRHCRTVGQCLLTMVHHGFVDTPYTSTEGQMTVDYDKTVRLSIINITHFILVTTIGLNIIFGIIVDTFSQLRDSKWEIDKDMQNNCFICSRESYDFERQGAGFEKHVKEEHYQWAYLFFFIHLDETRPNDYTALELFVFNLLNRNRFDFFPLNRALSLTNEEDSSERKIDDLRVKVDYIVNKLKEEEAAKERERERQRQLEWAAKHKKGSA